MQNIHFKFRMIFGILMVTSIFGLLMVCLQPSDKGDHYCRVDLQTGGLQCRRICEHGYFSLPGMTYCQPWLKCDRINREISPMERIAEKISLLKNITKVRWNNNTVILSTNKRHSELWINRHMDALDNLRNLQGSPRVIQLLGYCGLSYVTEFYPLGSADAYEKVLQSPAFQKYDNVKTRLGTCVSYIEAIHFLHNSPLGRRVFVDTHHLMKSLSQFLLTSDLLLVINDLDRIPEVDREGGLTLRNYDPSKEYNPFVAPEQRNGSEFDEKSDIWKIPAICNFFLGHTAEALKIHLSEINSRCKSETPSDRPSAEEVLYVYREVQQLVKRTPVT